MDVEVFIGNLQDENFDYKKGNYNGNIPKPISKFFPKSHKVFRVILQKIENKEIEGRQTDWGAWVATMYPNEILDLFKEFYNERDSKVIEKEIAKLDANEVYALVACEIG